MSGVQLLKAQNTLSTRLGEQAVEIMAIMLDALQQSGSICRNVSLTELYDGLSLLLLRTMLQRYATERELVTLVTNETLTLPFLSKQTQLSLVTLFGDLRWLSPQHHQRIQRLLGLIGEDKIDYAMLAIEHLGSVYEQIMELSLERDKQGTIILVDDEKRRATGAHYTPRILCDFTVQQSILRLLPSKPTAKDILGLRVCDPAMGSGAFLLAVLRYLSRELLLAWQREGVQGTALQARREIAESCLFGVDINPRATQLAQLSIWLELGCVESSLPHLSSQLQVGNSLLDSGSGDFDAGKDSFEWRERFPTIFQGSKNGFDLIIGNPPFINCIRGTLAPAVKNFIKKRYPLIKGAADLSYYFIELGTELIHEAGIVSMILPRVSMGAKALRGFRQSKHRPKPFVMYSAEHYHFFYNADIKVVVYILGQAKTTLVSNATLPTDEKWIPMSLDKQELWPSYRGNWWIQFSLACAKQEIPNTAKARPLKELGFEVHGGLTTDDFYKLRVEDAEHGSGLKLLTSGGIDPNRSYWGVEGRYQKFRKQRFQFPRIIEGEYSRSLQRKLKRSWRPKIIVANLTKELEAFFDYNGEYQGATATQTIYHNEDSVDQLRKLCELLHSEYGNSLFHHVLRYNAMHANISVEKEFLLEFPVVLD